MALDDISKTSETVEKFIRDLAEAFRKKSWVRLLSLGGVIFLLLLSPALVEYGLSFFNLPKPLWYSTITWLIITASFFIAAFLVAIFTTEKTTIPPAPATSIIKGLLAYTDSKEDSEWFARLQRGNILQDCLRFCEDNELAFGILSGESGTGKTSFLQAGLLLNLKNHGINPVYVKFTDSAPLDSIRQSLNGFGDTEQAPETETSLLEILRAAVKKEERPLVLIFDQFEQFFAHHKTKAKRKDFIAQMSEWYQKRKSLPVTILISIRNDFVDHLRDFQAEMKYTLTLPNYLSIKKFEPDEAAKVISVIAEEAKIEIDEAFVKELTKFELADREDGTVSPIDIQILSWMLDGQRASDERAFNRKAFQKLGGVEGLLERFLNRALSIRETESRRQSVIKVLLALTDNIVRAGALPLKDIKEKLKGVLPENDIEEAVEWLSRSDVRLVTPIQEKNSKLYEIAHERIIPPLRRLASKELSDVEKAEEILDKRTNEWLGNNRSRRYLLTFGELRFIRRNFNLLKIEAQKDQKIEFVQLSKKLILKKGIAGVSLMALIISGYLGYRRYENYQIWLEQQPERRIEKSKARLIELLDRNRDINSIVTGNMLFSVLDGEEEKKYSEKLWQRIIEIKDESDQEYAIRSLILYYAKLSKIDEALHRLSILHQISTKLPLVERLQYLSNLVEIYEILPATVAVQKSLEIIKKDQLFIINEISKERKSNGIEEATEVGKGTGLGGGMGHGDLHKNEIELLEKYKKIPDLTERIKNFDEILNKIRYFDNQILSKLINFYVELPESEIENSIDKVWNATTQDRSYLNLGILLQFVNSLEQSNDSEKMFIGTQKIWSIAEGKCECSIDIDLLTAFEKIYRKIPQPERSNAGLAKVRQKAFELKSEINNISENKITNDSKNKIIEHNELIELSKLFDNLGEAEASKNVLIETRKSVILLNSAQNKSDYLVEVSALFAKSGYWSEAFETSSLITDEQRLIMALSQFLIIWNDKKNNTEYWKLLEKENLLPKAEKRLIETES